jgi:hypothetical protein
MKENQSEWNRFQTRCVFSGVLEDNLDDFYSELVGILSLQFNHEMFCEIEEQ